jgi:sigma-E factor negative regulatory protein RseA
MSEVSKTDLQSRRQLMSALADGDAASAADACALWSADPAAREAWYTYHAIGDALRSDDLMAAPAREADFLAALRLRLAAEPTVLAPAPREAQAPVASAAAVRPRGWRMPAAVAAGFMAVAGLLVAMRAQAPAADLDPQLASKSTPQLSADRLGDPKWQVVDGKLIRDARLDGYLRAHRGSQVAMPGGATGRFETVVLER